MMIGYFNNVHSIEDKIGLQSFKQRCRGFKIYLLIYNSLLLEPRKVSLLRLTNNMCKVTKCINLVNLSTISKIKLNFLKVEGQTNHKFHGNHSLFHSKTSIHCIIPSDCLFSYFTYQKLRHLAMNSIISFYILYL